MCAQTPNSTTDETQNKEKSLKVDRTKVINCLRGRTVWMDVNFSTGTIKFWKKRHIFKRLKGKNCQPRIPYTTKILLKMKVKKIFSDIQKLEEFSSESSEDSHYKKC